MTRFLASLVLGVFHTLILLTMLPFVLVVAFGAGLRALIRAAELTVVYDGDEAARARDEWKSRSS